MKFEKRTNKDGTAYYSFVHYNPKTKKRMRLTRDEIKERFGHDIETEDEAKECLKLLEAQFETEKMRIVRRLDWESKYYNFVGLVEVYETWQKKNAPESWTNNVFYLKHYVLPFFLTEKKLHNAEMWPDHFEDFRDWLEQKAFLLRGAKKLISYSSKNHAVKALNTFLKSMLLRKLIAKEATCKPFPDHLVGHRDLDDVIMPDEADAVQATLNAQNHQIESIFHRFLYFTGLRYEEARGMSLGDIHQGQLEDSILGKALDNAKISYYGYVVVDSQYVKSLPDGRVLRKPLKGKKKISEREARVIPIIDKNLWNQLVDLSAGLHASYKTKVKGPSKRDYLFFQAITASSDTRLKQAFEANKLKYRSWHCCRHSRATFLIGELKELMIVRLWLGHKSINVLEKYNHIYQAIIRKAKSADALDGEFAFTKV